MATGEFLQTSYHTGENELEPVNLNDDDCPIELPSLQDNARGLPSQKVVGKSSRPGRKRRREDSLTVLVQKLEGGLTSIAFACAKIGRRLNVNSECY